ncbi:hypothetical protein FA15DRAFT_663390 [Coprinopsis marcescibilis]|uniref:Uncharacterized protein n=1 Tax=Coprinopsis marcescibilis TaxID=230819 RepID=A0A5C3LB27_COPMA|nr:hypothetical protein FA15DRAFT_663390 [Coprinopsis marcescibilis]
MGDSWWDWIRLSEFTYPDYVEERPLEPGEIAFAHGSLQAIFLSLVKSLGIKLTPLESSTLSRSNRKGRFCVVNGRFPDGRYQVFFLTTFGSAEDVAGIDPVGRFFGIPLGLGHSPSFDAVQTTQHWTGPSYVFGIPVVIPKHIAPTRLRNPHIVSKLVPGELERLRSITDLQLEKFQSVQGQVRRAEFDWRVSYLANRRLNASTDDKSRRLRVMPHVRNNISLKCDKNSIDGRHILRSSNRVLVSRADYLNTYRLSQHKSKTMELPQPFYSRKLRISLALIARIIH